MQSKFFREKNDNMLDNRGLTKQ